MALSETGRMRESGDRWEIPGVTWSQNVERWRDLQKRSDLCAKSDLGRFVNPQKLLKCPETKSTLGAVEARVPSKEVSIEEGGYKYFTKSEGEHKLFLHHPTFVKTEHKGVGSANRCGVPSAKSLWGLGEFSKCAEFEPPPTCQKSSCFQI